MKKVLIIEDETSIREFYAEMLGEAGYEVIQIGDGDAGNAAIEGGDWDLLLLDIMLPKLDGMEVLKKKQNNPSLKGKPVIIMSNLDNEEIVKECLNLGANGYFVKANIDPSQILETVNRFLSNG